MRASQQGDANTSKTSKTPSITSQQVHHNTNYQIPNTMPRGGEYDDGPTVASDNAITSGENKIAGAPKGDSDASQPLHPSHNFPLPAYSNIPFAFSGTSFLRRRPLWQSCTSTRRYQRDERYSREWRRKPRSDPGRRRENYGWWERERRQLIYGDEQIVRTAMGHGIQRNPRSKLFGR